MPSRWFIGLIAVFAFSSAVAADPNESDVRPTQAKAQCTRVIASALTYRELEVIGVVRQGRVRKILLTARNKSYIVSAGDCIARERVPFTQILRDAAQPFDDAVPPKKRLRDTG